MNDHRKLLFFKNLSILSYIYMLICFRGTSMLLFDVGNDSEYEEPIHKDPFPNRVDPGSSWNTTISGMASNYSPKTEKVERSRVVPCYEKKSGKHTLSFCFVPEMMSLSLQNFCSLLKRRMESLRSAKIPLKEMEGTSQVPKNSYWPVVLLNN